MVAELSFGAQDLLGDDVSCLAVNGAVSGSGGYG